MIPVAPMTLADVMPEQDRHRSVLVFGALPAQANAYQRTAYQSTCRTH